MTTPRGRPAAIASPAVWQEVDMSVTTVADLWRMSATELAEAIRTRQASSLEVVEAHLRRIEAVNPSINSPKLWGGIFVAIPTAIPEEPLSRS